MSKAPATQWIATIQGLKTKGIRQEEIDESGVLIALEQSAGPRLVPKDKVLEAIDFGRAIPQITLEAKFGFRATSGWASCSEVIPPSKYSRFDLPGKRGAAEHVIRYRHRSMGWMLIESQVQDLVSKMKSWWFVRDGRGGIVDGVGFGWWLPTAAMRFAEERISVVYHKWGRDHPIHRWRRYSLAGGEDYQELLFQLKEWPHRYKPRHFRTHNVLVHVRCSIRTQPDGRRVFFVDEVQSDWHADLASSRPETTPHVAPAPFRREWPLLALKVLLWMAQDRGLNGVAWSTPELQESRWKGYGPPTILYRKDLPEAARALAQTLGLAVEQLSLPVARRTVWVEPTNEGWQLIGNRRARNVKPFKRKEEAERMAENLSPKLTLSVPVLWLDGLPTLRGIPLWGAGTKTLWCRSESDCDVAADTP